MVFLQASALLAADKGAVIRVGGTGCALGGMKEVARAYEKRHPGVKLIFAPSLGSSGGIEALLADTIDVALSARALKDVELKQGAVSVEYARTPFVFVTSRKGHARDLTLDQLVSIYRGEIKTWPDGVPLRVILRPAGDTDTAFLKSLSPEMDKAVGEALNRAGMVTAVTDQENADMIEKIRGGFGLSTLAQVHSEQRHLSILHMNGVTPGIATLASGSYPYFKTLYAVTGPKGDSEVRDFISFLGSSDARAILTKSGHLVPQKRP